MGDVSHTGHRKHHPEANIKVFLNYFLEHFSRVLHHKSSTVILKLNRKTLLSHAYIHHEQNNTLCQAFHKICTKGRNDL
jgi:hypothetical protein